MKVWKLATAMALLIGVVIATLALSVYADEDEDGTTTAKTMSTLVKRAKVKLVDAIKTAEATAGGTAVAGRLELDDGRLMYEIFVVIQGKEPKIREVQIDAETGKTLAEEDDDEDDDDEG